MKAEMFDLQKNAYGYIRVSTEEQVDGASLLNQRLAIEAYATSHNIKVVGWYEDDGKSAKTAKRPRLQDMLADCKKHKGEIDYVIVYNLTRLSRNVDSFGRDIGPRLVSAGVKLLSTQENIDDSPHGNLMKNFALMMGQFDNDIKSEVVKDNMRLVAQQGYWQTSAPLGFQIIKVPVEGKSKDGKQKTRSLLEPDTRDDLCYKLTDILKRFAGGDMIPTNALEVAHDMGVRAKNGKPLSLNTMIHILRSPVYCGHICSKKLTGGEMVKALFDGIISRDVFERNKSILDGNKPNFNPQPNETYPLKVTLFCPLCGTRLRASAPTSGSGKKSPRYHCPLKGHGSISVSKMHQAFNDHLDTIMPTDGTVKLFKEITRRTARQRLGDANRQIETLRGALNALDDKVCKALDAFIAGDMSGEEKGMYIDRLKAERATTEAKISELEKTQRINESTIEYVCNFITMTAKLWRDSDYESRIALQRIIYPTGTTYNIKEGKFGTDRLSPLYSVMAHEKDALKRLELPHGARDWS